MKKLKRQLSKPMILLVIASLFLINCSGPEIGIIDHFVTIRPYTNGDPLFENRPYTDEIKDARLDATFLIQMPRHYRDTINIHLNRKVIIYRLVSDANNNDFLNEWETSDIQVHVKGSSCSHTEVVSKMFEPGKYKLPPGGPTASSPILIQTLEGRKNTLPITNSKE